MKFLVFIEQRDGKIRKASLEALSLARKLELPPARQAVKLIPADDPAAAAKELVRLLREEAKVI